MRKTLKIPADEVTPSIKAILSAQGLPDISRADDRLIRLAENARIEFRKLAKPSGIIAEISAGEFRHVFNGEGNNEKDAPLESIYQASDTLALFAVTVGAQICDAIRGQFDKNEFPAGSMLDSAASEGAELTARAVERHYVERILSNEEIDLSKGVMRFSPGYCGWHISAQKRLFGFLNPGEIGITINDSCLMTPLKSISGVIVTGEKAIFEFDDIFDFCVNCEDRSCRDRIKALTETDSY
jgi:hypothetical protein